MKHTKNILKSLLITVMALSLLAVSCSKDEGGSKPTSPTPTKLEIAVEAVKAVAIGAEEAATQVKTDGADATEPTAILVEGVATAAEKAKAAVEEAASTNGKITDATAKQEIKAAAEKITKAAQSITTAANSIKDTNVKNKITAAAKRITEAAQSITTAVS